MEPFAEFLALDARRRAGGLAEAEEARYQDLRRALSVVREPDLAALPRVWADAFPEAARALGEVALRAPAALEEFLREARGEAEARASASAEAAPPAAEPPVAEPPAAEPAEPEPGATMEMRAVSPTRGAVLPTEPALAPPAFDWSAPAPPAEPASAAPPADVASEWSVPPEEPLPDWSAPAAEALLSPSAEPEAAAPAAEPPAAPAPEAVPDWRADLPGQQAPPDWSADAAEPPPVVREEISFALGEPGTNWSSEPEPAAPEAREEMFGSVPDDWSSEPELAPEAASAPADWSAPTPADWSAPAPGTPTAGDWSAPASASGVEDWSAPVPTTVPEPWGIPAPAAPAEPPGPVPSDWGPPPEDMAWPSAPASAWSNADAYAPGEDATSPPGEAAPALPPTAAPLAQALPVDAGFVAEEVEPIEVTPIDELAEPEGQPDEPVPLAAGAHDFLEMAAAVNAPAAPRVAPAEEDLPVVVEEEPIPLTENPDARETATSAAGISIEEGDSSEPTPLASSAADFIEMARAANLALPPVADAAVGEQAPPAMETAPEAAAIAAEGGSPPAAALVEEDLPVAIEDEPLPSPTAQARSAPPPPPPPAPAPEWAAPAPAPALPADGRSSTVASPPPSAAPSPSSPPEPERPVARAVQFAAASAPVPQAPAATPPPPSLAPAPAFGAPGSGSPAFVAGSHRVAVHTIEGQVKRGVVNNLDLLGDDVQLAPIVGGPIAETIPMNRVRAVFFMLPPGEKPPPASGRRLRVTFADGRDVEGFSDDYSPDARGFFLVPADARGSTARIYVVASAVRSVV